MANGYVSQVQLPNNETYNIKDKELIPRLKATVGHSNKNLLDLKNIKGKTEYGITWTIDEQEGIVTATGTVQTGKTAQLSFVFKDIPSGNYYFYGCIGGSGSTYDVYCWDYTANSHPKQWDGTTNVYSDYNLVPRQLKIVDNHEIGITLRINSGVTVNNLIFKPMVWDGNIFDDTFEPYQEPTDKLIETKARTYLNSTVGHACKNLLDVTKYTTISGISDIQINEDTGSLSFTGTGTWRCISYLINDDISLKPNGITYILTCINNLATSTAQLAIRRGDTNTIVYSTSLSTTGKKELKFTASSEKFPNGWYISILVTKGTSSTGSADVSNLMLREASIADDTFESYQTPTDERFKDYLPLTGGTLTGRLIMSDKHLSLKSTNIDSDGGNPTSNTQSNSELNFIDKDGTRMSFLNVQERTDGSIKLELGAQNNNNYNVIDLIVGKDGTKSYSVSDPAAFRAAIGAGTSSTDNKTQQTINNDDKHYPLLFSYAERNNTTKNVTDITYRNNDCFIIPSSGYIYSKKGFCAGPFTTGTAGKRVWIEPNGIHANNFLANYSIQAYEKAIIRAWAGKHTSADGLLLTIDSGGLTMIGGGESSTNLANLIDDDQTTTSPKRLDINNSAGASGKKITAFTGDSEQLILSSDDSIFFATKCQTIANRVAVCLNGNRDFYPMTNNTGSIGSSSYKWQYGYFGQVYTKNLQVGGGTESGTLTLYGYSNGGSTSGELIQPFNGSGGTITHSLPLLGGDLFGSGNLVAGEGISRSESGGIYTISTESDIVLSEVDLDNSKVDDKDNYIQIVEFVNLPYKNYYIEIYYTANNGKSPGIARIPLTTGMVPQSSGAVGNEFTLSITGDINTMYIRTSCFKFKTPSTSHQSIRLYGQSSYIVTFVNPSGTSSETKNSYTIQKKTVSDGNYTGFWVVPYKMRFIQEK